MRVAVFFFIVLIAPLAAGVYGILHDQFTVTFSEEYFTKFKFAQFGILDTYKNTEFSKRLLTSYVGFMATWWTGLPIGVAIGFAGLMQKNWIEMYKVSMNSMAILVAVTVLTGLAGLGYGHFFLSEANVDWNFPANLIDKKSFVMVGSMHNFSYLGGVLGLIAAVLYQFRVRFEFLKANRQAIIPIKK